MSNLHHSNAPCDHAPDDGGAAMRHIGKNCCQLCNEKARIFCAADGAQLCLGCDFKVHSANFLVGRHSRNVLCAFCGALTLSALSGPRIDLHRVQHCAQCGGSGGNDEVSSNESRNSSCCTESSIVESKVPISPALKRPAIACFEEGCGDSEDRRHSRSPKWKCVTFSRTCSHTPAVKT